MDAAPNIVSKEERTSAENIILTFRKTRNAFVFCKFILENSQTEIVLFETADVLRNNLVQDWSKISSEEIQHLNNHILGLLFTSTGFSYSIQRRLAGVVALIVKHQSLINNGKQRTELISHILSNAMSSTGQSLVVACCILDALMGEHQYVVNATDASLAYEMHFAAKKDFENSDLVRIFQFCLQYLSAYEHNALKKRDLDHVLKILESILYWNFTKNNLPKRIAGVIEMETTPAFKPPNSWLHVVNDTGFIPTFFSIHVKVREDENFVPRTVNLMTQLVTMHRPAMNKDTRVDFLSRILPSFTALLEIPNKLPVEVYGLSDVVRKILLFNRAALLSFVPAPVLEGFLKAVGGFSCQVIQQATIEEGKVGVDDRVYRESLTRVLEAWMNILTDTENVPKEVVQPIVTSIFNHYLQAHLSPPEGFRQPIPHNADDSEDEEDLDTNQFRDQLQAAGIFGRFILHHSVPILTQLLSFKCQALQKQMELVASNVAQRETLNPIFEDLHWGILIAGHVLAFDGLGETNLIPAEINEMSLETRANPDTSAVAFEKSFEMIAAGAEESVDPIVRLVSCVIIISETERRVSASGMAHLLSPELTANVLWFLHRFSQSYFFVNEEYYASISPCFLACWGVGSLAAKGAQNNFLRRIREDLIRYSGEVEVMREAINLLLALVDSPRKAESAIQSPELLPLVQLTSEVGPGKYQMPNEIYRKFVRAVICVGTCCEDEQRREEYWERILGSLLSRFRQFVTLTSIDRHRDDVRLELSCVLSGFIGTAMSAHSRIASPLYQKIAPVVAECGSILDAYHNYVDIVELCLELVIEVCKRSLSYLSAADSLGIYQAAMSVVKSYALHASGRISSEKSAEEDTYNDLVLLIEMLTCLLAKDFLDLGPDALINPNSTPPVSASDVSLHGLGIVLPLLNGELLQYPNLSSKYFRLIAFLSELHAERMLTLPPMMMQALYESVSLGLQGATTETFSSCCEFITCIAQHIARHNQQNTPSAELCKPFLKVFLEMVLSQRISKDNIPAVSTCLFILISAFSDTYNDLVNQLLSTRADEESRTALSDAFSKLTENLNMVGGGDRASRANFRDRLENFIFTARGCLE
ncbi:Exportin-4 [Orchesella cincta]|uniref:Exportin-4 n=1 Tax=Orchesella cincta TaxID=48709 RepID=A0A1D2NET7_ORCCI|nr:Exportin-4 [Orchesella cincta]